MPFNRHDAAEVAAFYHEDATNHQVTQEPVDAAFQEMDKERADAIIVQPSLPSQRVAELALKYKIPAASAVRWFAEEGGLMSYSASRPI